MLKMEKLRPYVCVAVNNFTRGTYPVHRIDASGLFYQKDQGKVTTTPPVEHPLPRPCISFSPSPCRSGCGVLDFLGLFGLCQKRNLLAAVDYQGVSRVYDVDDCIVNITPAPQEPKCCEPVSIDLGGAFYVLDRQLIPGRQKCFEALTFGPPNLFGTPRWHWRSIQPPPFIFDPGYETTRIGAYTVVGDSSIMISTPLGTYTFDTMSSSWDKAGDWELPFHGRVEFFPKYGAWLGFSAQDNRLCYSSKVGATRHQPVLDMVWDDPNPQLLSDYPNPQRYTHIVKSQLVHLGSLEFCLVRLYEDVENELTEHGTIPQMERFIVLTGLVLKPSESGSGIEMIPHKSQLYRFEGVSNCWIL